MAAYQERLDALGELGVTVIAAAVDDRETMAGMVQEDGLTFPVAYGVSQESVASLGPWWMEDNRHGRYLQPMEFLVRANTVLGSMYASGPIGRMDVEQALAFIRSRERR